MKTLALAISVLAISVAGASAADLPARPYTKAPPMVVNPAYDWSGFYVGGHIGYIWGRTRVEDDGVLTESGAPTEGVIGGALAGYNWQRGSLVFGLEGDIGWSNAQGHGASVPAPVFVTPNTYDLNWTSHILGRFGYANAQWLFFVAGGLSIADVGFINGETNTPETRGGQYVGFSLGAGVEYAFTRNLLGRVQYLYDDFGGKNYVAADGGLYHLSLTSSTLRGALAWKF